MHIPNQLPVPSVRVRDLIDDAVCLEVDIIQIDFMVESTVVPAIAARIFKPGMQFIASDSSLFGVDDGPPAGF